MNSFTALVLSVMWTACLLGGFLTARYALKEHKAKQHNVDSCRYCGCPTLIATGYKKFFCPDCDSEGLLA